VSNLYSFRFFFSFYYALDIYEIFISRYIYVKRYNFLSFFFTRYNCFMDVSSHQMLEI
jgi:hypothetical protein